MNPTRRRALATMLATAAWSTRAFAQSGRYVRLVVPTSAGGATDATARALQPGLAAALGAPVVVENMPGASGVVGLRAVARAGPQDMTFAVITNSVAILPSVMKAFPFDVAKDFTPIAMLAYIPMTLAVNSKVPASNAKDLTALLRQKKDGLNFGSSGAGSVSHLATEMFLESAGVKATHVPYQGPGPMTVALLGDQVEFASQGLPVFQPHFKTGALRAIGVYSSKRTSLAPEIPTFVEQGFSDVLVEAWVTLLGPKGMHAAAVKKVNDAAVQAFGTEATKEQLARQGTVVSLTSPGEARATIDRELARYAALTKKLGLEPQ
jgi:tripartite-type tricarboxylate transporter receptor subunit TctC